MLFEDFEDLLPSEEMSGKLRSVVSKSYAISGTQNCVNNAAVEIAVDSDASSDVVIVEELSQVSKNSIVDRVLRPRTSLNAFHLRCFSLSAPPTSKVHRSKKVRLLFMSPKLRFLFHFLVVCLTSQAVVEVAARSPQLLRQSNPLVVR